MTDSASRTSRDPGADVARGNEVAADAALVLPVWDLPIRLVHWGLVVLLAFSWWTIENEEIAWHIRSGLAVMFLLLFRVLWGFFGSSTARFVSFVRGPRAVLAYLRDPAGWRAVGHNPLGALSVLALLGILVLQIWFGLPLSDEYGVDTGPLNRLVSFETAEWSHGVHEWLFTALQLLVALHVAAILFYRLRGRKLVGAMVTGSSRVAAAGAEPMVAAPPARLALCLAVAGAVTWWVSAGVPGL